MSSYSYDLTILTLFTGNRTFFDPYLKALKELRKPAGTQLLFIDNSNDPIFNDHLKKVTPHVIEYRDKPAPGAADQPSMESQYLKGEHCARLYAFAKGHILGRDLLIIEHDVIPKPDALEKLQSSRARYRADFISASVLSRLTGEWLGWRLKRNHENLNRVFIGRRPKRVLATGFGFLLTTSELYKRMRTVNSDPRYTFFGCDIHAGVWAREQNLRWFIDGGVRCGHLREDREFARLGDLMNTVTGPLFDMQSPELAPS